MGIDLSRFKVVYDNKVLNALCLQDILFPEGTDYTVRHKKPEIIEVIVINEDGNIEAIRDDAWRFQFIPIVGGA